MPPTRLIPPRDGSRKGPTVLKAPTSVPTADPDINVTNNALIKEDPPVPVPVTPEPAAVASDYPLEDTNDILDLLDDSESTLEARRRGVSPDAPAALSGTFRDSYFSKVVRDWVKDPSTMVNKDLEVHMNTWLRDLLELHTTVESSIQDFGSAITENGAQIVFDITGVKKIAQEFVWIRKIGDLADILKVGEYADGVILRDIEQTFGRAPDTEEEKARKERVQHKQALTVGLKLLQGIHSAINKPVAPTQPESTVFSGPRRRAAVRKAGDAASET